MLGGDPAVYTMLEPADGYEVREDTLEMEYRVVPGAGHSPHRDVPDATRELRPSGCSDRRPMDRRLISSGSTFEEQIGYSRAVVAGDWVFVSAPPDSTTRP